MINILIIVLLLWASEGFGIAGDQNKDGTVDFDGPYRHRKTLIETAPKMGMVTIESGVPGKRRFEDGAID